LGIFGLENRKKKISQTIIDDIFANRLASYLFYDNPNDIFKTGFIHDHSK
jgi:hypothetical protein